MISTASPKVVYLSGGVGGARLLLGMSRVLPEGQLTAVVNTGDDFVHWGLRICPDLDTVMYTLAGRSDFARGWGLDGETFGALSLVQQYGGEDWFSLGDHDLGTHLMRNERLGQGQTLTQVTRGLCGSLGVTADILPMTDAPVQTMIDTTDGRSLPFQRWFVQERTQPKVARVWLRGEPTPTPAVTEALAAAELIVIGPSNPYVSIDTILQVPGIADAVARRPVIAVSPIVGGRAVKGPLAEMIAALTGGVADAGAIARHYGGRLAAMVVESGDQDSVEGLPVYSTGTIMKTPDDSRRLAEQLLAFARERVL